ncbi:hypothetical protein NHE_0341 [Neorickettsia helminthoeca str. Oregon]|uniref:Uncharacterized protein n=1 Tax=Neorickettsia helminthoeca str. Oregon TaxID=1286528 RepID=X5H3M0_9RICK|nr:hypothetical protein [Neorickettsia helminthoeca]AHX11293.1 hypothetical protein NHE_0341 [Neorickettsia helminthoeca str. Oregon]
MAKLIIAVLAAVAFVILAVVLFCLYKQCTINKAKDFVLPSKLQSSIDEVLRLGLECPPEKLQAVKEQIIKEAKRFVSTFEVQYLLEELELHNQQFSTERLQSLPSETKESLKLYSDLNYIHEMAFPLKDDLKNGYPSREDYLRIKEILNFAKRYANSSNHSTSDHALNFTADPIKASTEGNIEKTNKYRNISNIFIRDGYDILLSKVLPPIRELRSLDASFGYAHTPETWKQTCKKLELICEEIFGATQEASDNFAAVLYLERQDLNKIEQATTQPVRIQATHSAAF